ncbi:hypothetical protein LCGC14_1461340 [marine sediment metagenome]|uniref:Uncharacterized protein n=1 Tax=marine sediment metagenome TaxID=412755 RepID=A0A0F9K132_9ZZZZ
MPRKAIVKKKVNEAAQLAAYESILEALARDPEIVEAGLSRADLELALEDKGFIRLGGPARSGELEPASRQLIVERARLYWHRDPLCKQAVRLWTDYSVGDGLSFRAERPAVQAVLEEFWKHRKNRRILRARGQRKSSTKLLVDGEVFFALFGDTPLIRRIDPLEITDIVSLPDDKESPVFYRRQFMTPAGAQRTLYYLDWAFADAEADDVPLLKDEKGDVIVPKPNVFIYHLPFDDFAQRGNSLLGAVLDWCREHRRFMTSRVAITQALAKFALKLTLQGGAGTLAAAKIQLKSTADQDTGETNPPPVAGATWLENKAATLTAMPRSTGGRESRDDSDLLKLMVSAGTGIMLHYFGDPSTGNLATSTSMELPMRKAFGAYRQLWIEFYEDLFGLVLARHDMADEKVDIDLPPILDADIAALGQSLTAVKAAQPEIPGQPEMIQHTLSAYRLNNVAEIVKRIMKEMEEKSRSPSR